jgi:hypothetical protein
MSEELLYEKGNVLVAEPFWRQGNHPHGIVMPAIG